MYTEDPLENIIISAGAMSSHLAYLTEVAKFNNDESALYRLTDIEVWRATIRNEALKLQMNTPRPSLFRRIFKK